MIKYRLGIKCSLRLLNNWTWNIYIYKTICTVMCCRCVLVLVWQCLHIGVFFIWLFVTFPPFPSLDTGKPKCLHMLELKLTGVFAVSQNLLLVTCGIRHLWVDRSQARADDSFRSHFPRLCIAAAVKITLFTWKSEREDYLKPSRVRKDTEKLLSPWHPEIDDGVTSLPQILQKAPGNNLMAHSP